jgi:hypothetical protein
MLISAVNVMRVTTMFTNIPMVAVAHRLAFIRVSARHSIFVQIDFTRGLAEHVLSTAVGAIYCVRFSMITVPAVADTVLAKMIRAGHVTGAITNGADSFRHFLLSCKILKNKCIG